MKRLPGTIFAGTNAEWVGRKKKLSRSQLGFNTQTGELRKGPGWWDECAPAFAGSVADLTVRLATTTNVTIATGLNAGDTIDGVTLVDGDLVLVKDHATPATRGIYVVGDTPARATGYTTFDPHAGILVYVEEGSSNAGLHYLNTNDTGGTLDTTAITFNQVVPMRVSLESRLQYSNAAAKATVVDADLLLIEDSADGGAKKRVAMSVIKTYVNA
jgi:hypothetical protein